MEEKKETKFEKKEKEKIKKEKKIGKEKEKTKLEKIEEAKVRGLSLPLSLKHCVAICKFIKGKNPYEAIDYLEKVRKKKEAIPMTGEIPHRKKISSGRYPVKASLYFIKLLKNLIANASNKGMDEKNLIIVKAKADKASRPSHGGRTGVGKKFKRSHVLIIAKEK